MNQEDIKKVIIAAGVHGNELSGIHLVRSWSEDPAKYRRDNVQTSLMLANRKAIAACRRYIDEDLNRCFSQNKLDTRKPKTHEGILAKEINDRLGGKGSPDAPDLILDLHNTTTNMGISLLFGQITPFLKKFFAYLSAQDEDVRLYYMPETQSSSPYFPTISERDICVEVGPLAHGTLDADLYFQTEAILEKALDFVDQWQGGTLQLPEETEVEVYTLLENLDYPRDELGRVTAMIHPSLKGMEYQPLKPGDPLFVDFEGNITYYEGDEIVYPTFIGEQAYYEKGIAMSLTRMTLETW